MQALDEAEQPEASQPVASQPVARVGLPEAPASANGFVTIAGRQVQVTLRGVDETDVLRRMEQLFARYPVAEHTPKPPAAEVHQATAPAAGEQREDWCYVCHAPMELRRGTFGPWSQHTLPGGQVCKGKPRRARR